VNRRSTDRSVQPTWCRELSVQQQSVLFLAGRGPDGVGKAHPCKAIQVAYRGCVFVAAMYGRCLEWGERADSFMSLDVFADSERWQKAVDEFFKHHDALPHHYLMHLMHGAQILGYKHPDSRFREHWNDFYIVMCENMHVNVETEVQMDERLNDWEQVHW
jgi:hypothetical protein